MREKIAFSLIPVALIAGFFVGRQFPRHRYERFGNGPYLYDLSVGKLCDPRPAPKNPIDAAVQNQPKGVPPGFVLQDEFDRLAAKNAELSTPPCGNE
jgi:hypothetical protein